MGSKWAAADNGGTGVKVVKPEHLEMHHRYGSDDDSNTAVPDDETEHPPPSDSPTVAASAERKHRKHPQHRQHRQHDEHEHDRGDQSEHTDDRSLQPAQSSVGNAKDLQRRVQELEQIVENERNEKAAALAREQQFRRELDALQTGNADGSHKGRCCSIM